MQEENNKEEKRKTPIQDCANNQADEPNKDETTDTNNDTGQHSTPSRRNDTASGNNASKASPSSSFGFQNSGDLKYHSRDGTYFSQLYNQPLVTTLSSFSQVANLVRNPYELLNNVDEFVRQASGTGGVASQKRRSSRNSENFARTLNQNRQSLTPSKTPVLQEMDTFVAHDRDSTTIINDNLGAIDSNGPQASSPIPTLPSIDATSKRGRSEPLTIEEYESKFRQSSSDLELIERVFAGSMACNQLRAALWPYLFGLVQHRGRFQRIEDPSSGKAVYIFVDHEANNSRWCDLDHLYESYKRQWLSILPDQENRFSTFRERRSLIDRDVIRCDRLHPFYAQEPKNLEKLTELLMTYMMYDFDIGYVQGMSDIAGPILYMYNGDLIRSFWVFVEVMKLFRRNFELTQKTIHFQLNCLYALIKQTDPIFAQYLEENESSNCFFAFRAIVCQFKRELMKEDEDDYGRVLFLWDTIWCVARRCDMQQEMDGSSDDANMPKTKDGTKDGSKVQTGTPRNSSAPESPYIFSIDPNQADSLRYKLTETEIFVLALCLSMIRRERDLVLANRLDGTDIHLHFIDPKLANDLNSFIEHAINIYSFLKNDFDLNKLVGPLKEQITPVHNTSSSEQQATESMDTNADASPVSANDYDSLSDFLIINGASGS